MKTNFVKNSLMTLMFAAFAMLTLASCNKDDDNAPVTLRSQVEGTWDFTSFKVDAFEYMEVVVDSAYIRFEAYTGDEGNFEQMVLYTDGEREIANGKYEVDEAAKEITMTALGETIVAKVTHIASGKMEWEGEEEGSLVEVKIQRR